MLQDKVQEVFNEPGCAKNQTKTEKERKKGCTKALKPGAAALKSANPPSFALG